MAALADAYNAEGDRLWHLPKSERMAAFNDEAMKWTRSAKRSLVEGRRASRDEGAVVEAMYRPFDRRLLKFDRQWVEMPNLMEIFFGKNSAGQVRSIVFTDPTSQKPFMTLAVDRCADMHLVGAAAGGVVVPITQVFGGPDNITDWALNKFIAQYGKKGVTKDAIFHYVYAVLHDPVYRETYALNLKREFPRIPFYPDFAQWAAWGEALMALHIGYEEVAPWSVERIDTPDPKRAEDSHPKLVLKSHPEKGAVVVDAETQITGIPREAWDYRLGNRSAIDWVLDQHKEKTPRDPTIREKFNTYRFADYKESMIDLLAKVVRVSVDTVAITEAMRASERPQSEAAA